MTSLGVMWNNWQSIIVLGLIIPAIIVIFYLIHKLDDKKDKVIATLSVLVPFLLLLFQTFLSEPSIQKDYEAHNRPWLEPTLIISKLEIDSFRISYEIENAGKLPAQNLRLFFHSPEVKKIDKSIRHPRHIAPGGRIIYEPNPLHFNTKYLPSSAWFKLFIDYHSIINEEDRSYSSVFGVFLRKNELAEGRYMPSAIGRLEGEFSDDQLEDFLGFKMNFKQ